MATWYVAAEQKVFGPYSDDQLRQFAGQNRINESTPVSCDGKNWIEAGAVSGLFTLSVEPRSRADSPSIRQAVHPPAKAKTSAHVDAASEEAIFNRKLQLERELAALAKSVTLGQRIAYYFYPIQRLVISICQTTQLGVLGFIAITIPILLLLSLGLLLLIGLSLPAAFIASVLITLAVVGILAFSLVSRDYDELESLMQSSRESKTARDQTRQTLRAELSKVVRSLDEFENARRREQERQLARERASHAAQAAQQTTIATVSCDCWYCRMDVPNGWQQCPYCRSLN